MGHKVYFLILLLFVPFVVGYQQGHAVFDLPSGWNVTDQASNRQLFEKQGMELEVRASQGKLIDTYEFAHQISGEVKNEVNGSKYQAAIVSNEILYVFGRMEYDDLTYLFTIGGKPSQLNSATRDMKAILDSVEFSDNPTFVEAPWEREGKIKEPLPFFEKHPIPWFWIIVILIIVFLIYRRRRKKKKHKEKHSEKKSKKSKH